MTKVSDIESNVTSIRSTSSLEEDGKYKYACCMLIILIVLIIIIMAITGEIGNNKQ